MSEKEIFIVFFSGGCSLLGIIFLIVGFVISANWRKKKRNCVKKIDGIVRDIVRKEFRINDQCGNYEASWFPVIEYEIGGNLYIKESKYGFSEAKYCIGERIEILYNPQNPHEYYISNELLQKKLGIIFTCVGVVCICVAVVVAVLVSILA